MIGEDIVKQIPIIYEETKSKAETARRLGISPSTVGKYLTKLNCANLSSEQRESEKNRRVEITPGIIEEINTLYQQYRNMSKVAQKLGVSSSTVKRYLNEDNLKLSETINNDRDALFFYIIRLFGIVSEESPVSAWNLTQMNRLKSKGYSYRAQLLTLKYFYEVKHNSIEKSNGSIGIISYVYDEAAAYYKKIESRKKEIDKAIEKQLEKDRVEIPYNPANYVNNKKKKKLIDLNNL